MTNAVRGEVELKAADQLYKLVLDFNALADLEDHLDLSVADILQKLRGQIRGSFLRMLLWGALQRHHEGLTKEDAGDIIQEVGVAEVLLKIWEAINRSFPAQTDEGAAEGPSDPPPPAAKTRRRAGTGTGS